jgi:hypothetical protein
MLVPTVAAMIRKFMVDNNINDDIQRYADVKRDSPSDTVSGKIASRCKIT